VVASFSGETVLRHCLESLEPQAAEAEVIVATDVEASGIARLEARYPRFRFVRAPRGTPVFRLRSPNSASNWSRKRGCLPRRTSGRLSSCKKAQYKMLNNVTNVIGTINKITYGCHGLGTCLSFLVLRISDNVEIRAFCDIEDVKIGTGATIGPFARIRGGAELGADVHLGNFVEVKNSRIGAGTKAGHLSYLGDAVIGEKTNIGAGTITCNYDGVNKDVTTIGSNVFIGSNASLVAPVTIGDGAYTASGSVITEDVPADAVAFGRARQENKPGYAPKLREKALAKKAAKQAGKGKA